MNKKSIFFPREKQGGMKWLKNDKKKNSVAKHEPYDKS